MIATTLEEALKHLKRLLETRLEHYLSGAGSLPLDNIIGDIWRSLSDIPHFRPFDAYEQVILLAALAPYLRPNFYEAAVSAHIPQGGDLIELGGVRSGNYRGMMPTGDTLLFLLAGNDLDRRVQIQHLFEQDQPLFVQEALSIEPVKEGEPPMSGRLLLGQGWRERILYGKEEQPRFGPDFPARLLTTQMEWADTVLNPHTQAQIDHMQVWLTYNNQLMQEWDMGKKIKRGYRALFYGPPGTGKTMVAGLLGKQFRKEVYRIDISQVVSKYIGETEKNLEKIFTRAEHKDWILFCDECDALFGKRMSVSNAHDKFANQEVSYLLQRIEDHPALIILASNFKNNIDNAFLRRFNTIISFPLPTEEERLLLWQKSVPPKMDVPFSFEGIARKYEMSGASILNVVHYAALRSLSSGLVSLREPDIVEGIREEFQKEDRFFKA
jgi:hypothetical protein